MGGLALAVYAFDRDGAVAVGVLALVRTVCAGFAAPFLGTLGDRHPRVRVMVASDLVRVVGVTTMAGIVFGGGPALIVYALAMIGSVAGTAFRPAQAALVPSLARTPEELTASNVASSTTEGIGIFAGPALGGFLLALTSTEVVFLATAALFLGSALLVAGIHEPRAEAEEDEGSSPPRRSSTAHSACSPSCSRSTRSTSAPRAWVCSTRRSAWVGSSGPWWRRHSSDAPDWRPTSASGCCSGGCRSS